jgi:hypothetical protein
MNTLKKIVGKTRLNHVRNQDIMEQCGIQPKGEWVNTCKRREEWNNHISRMTEDRTVRVLRDNSPVMNFLPASCYVLSLRSKYSLQHPVLYHLQSLLCSPIETRDQV